MSLSAGVRSRKSWRSWARIAAVALILNEVRGIVTVLATAPVWWPLILGLFHTTTRGG